MEKSMLESELKQYIFYNKYKDGPMLFLGKQFSNKEFHIIFEEVKNKSLILKNCIFEGPINLNYTVDDKIEFSNCKFEDSVYFQNRFNSSLSLRSCIFNGSVLFDNTIIKGSNPSDALLIITDCIFNKTITFVSINFDVEFNISNTTFKDEFIMTSGTFNQISKFNLCIFHKRLQLKGICKSHLNIVDNVFYDIIDVEGLTIKGLRHMHHNKLKKTALNKPESLPIISNLKKNSTDSGQVDSFFDLYYHEQRAKHYDRIQTIKSSQKNKFCKAIYYIREYLNPARLYHLFSNFGNSVARPIILLFILTILMPSILFFLSNSTEYFYKIGLATDRWITSTEYNKSLLLSIKGILNPIYKFDHIRPKSGWPTALFIFNTIFQYILLAFLFTALRRKFKAKQ